VQFGLCKVGLLISYMPDSGGKIYSFATPWT
jgi:hypothetical protein